jgi:hypothetical protein
MRSPERVRERLGPFPGRDQVPVHRHDHVVAPKRTAVLHREHSRLGVEREARTPVT